MPEIGAKVLFCRQMGWTFTEYDTQPADEVLKGMLILALVKV